MYRSVPFMAQSLYFFLAITRKVWYGYSKMPSLSSIHFKPSLRSRMASMSLMAFCLSSGERTAM